MSDEVIKESFYEIQTKFEEEFDNTELAVKSNRPSESAKIDVLDIKFEKSKITKKNKEQHESKENIGTEASAGKDSSKDAQAQK